MNNLTEFHRLKVLLQGTQPGLQAILENTRLYLWSYDLVEDAFVYISPGLRELFGIGKNKLVTKQWEEQIIAEDKPIWEEVHQLREQGLPFRAKVRIRTLSDELKWVDVLGIPVKENGSGAIRYDGVTVDISDRIEFESDSKELLHRYESLLDLLPDGLFVYQEDGIIGYANHAAHKMLGVPRSESCVGRSILEFVHESSLEMAINRVKLLVSTRSIVGDEMILTLRRTNGETFIGEIRSALIEEGASLSVMTLVQDITEKTELSQRMVYLAYHDTLCNLPNRWHFYDYVSKILSGEGSHSCHAVFMLDFDRFKDMNDIYGHDFGDKVIQKLAENLASASRNFFAARIGGDEFALLVANTESSQVKLEAEQLRIRLCSPINVDGVICHLTPSIGIAMYPESGEDVVTLIKNADIAMYNAKYKGGNRIEFFLPEHEVMVREKVWIEKSIRQALDDNQFYLEYQPKVDLKNGRVVAVEALLRCHEQRLHELGPAGFIPVAEDTGLILALGEWVLREACRQNTKWQEEGRQPVVVAVNVSPKQFFLQDIYELIKRVLAETGMEASWLCIEITEGLMVENPHEVTVVLRKIREMGVHISIDDFGKGYSSLQYLRLFEAGYVKIDREFVSSMTEDLGNRAIVEAIIQLSHTFGMEVVAEGIETKEQRDLLEDFGCDLGQGYLFSAAKSAETIEKVWLKKQ